MWTGFSQKLFLILKMGMLPVLLSSGGCALLYEGRYDFDEGWRAGKVVESGLGTSIAHSSQDDCRPQIPTDAVARTQFAYVAFYNSNRILRSRIARVGKGVTLNPGDSVYINIQNCEAAIVAKATGLNSPSTRVFVPLWHNLQQDQK